MKMSKVASLCHKGKFCYEIRQKSILWLTWSSRPTLGRMKTLKLQRKRQKLLVPRRYQNIISSAAVFKLPFNIHYCTCVKIAGFHWRHACRVCGGLHLAGPAGQCHLRGPIPAGHRDRTALHRTQAGGDCTQGGRPVCLSWCNRKGKRAKSCRTTMDKV